MLKSVLSSDFQSYYAESSSHLCMYYYWKLSLRPWWTRSLVTRPGIALSFRCLRKQTASAGLPQQTSKIATPQAGLVTRLLLSNSGHARYHGRVEPGPLPLALNHNLNRDCYSLPNMDFPPLRFPHGSIENFRDAERHLCLLHIRSRMFYNQHSYHMLCPRPLLMYNWRISVPTRSCTFSASGRASDQFSKGPMLSAWCRNYI